MRSWTILPRYASEERMTDRFRPSPNVVAREVGDEQVLLDLVSGAYYGLNAVGTAVWQHLEREPADLASLVAGATEMFAVDADVAETDIGALLAELQSKGLVEAA